MRPWAGPTPPLKSCELPPFQWLHHTGAMGYLSQARDLCSGSRACIKHPAFAGKSQHALCVPLLHIKGRMSAQRARSEVCPGPQVQAGRLCAREGGGLQRALPQAPSAHAWCAPSLLHTFIYRRYGKTG